MSVSIGAGNTSGESNGKRRVPRNNAAGASGRKASPEFSETDCQPSVSL